MTRRIGQLKYRASMGRPPRRSTYYSFLGEVGREPKSYTEHVSYYGLIDPNHNFCDYAFNDLAEIYLRGNPLPGVEPVPVYEEEYYTAHEKWHRRREQLTDILNVRQEQLLSHTNDDDWILYLTSPEDRADGLLDAEYTDEEEHPGEILVAGGSWAILFIVGFVFIVGSGILKSALIAIPLAFFALLFAMGR